MISTTDWHGMAADADLTIENLIDGQAKPITGDITITKYSPRDGHLLYRFNNGSEADVNAAVASARNAYNDGRWQDLALGQRQSVLNKLADLIEMHKDRFALYECLDVGKPISNALTLDIGSATSVLRGSANKASQLLAPCGADGGAFAYQRRKPIGVVGGITGWNYPLTLAANKLGPALIMGNSVVLKPSEFTSLSTRLLAELALEAGVPPGVFNVVHGAGSTVGATLAAHPDVDLLSFVGSSATGKQIMIAAGQSNMKRLVLECGGKSPYLVFDDCPDDLDALADDIVAKAFPNQGALCVAGTRLLLQTGIKEKLMPLILEKSTAIKASDPLDPSTTFGALINEDHMNKVLAYIDSGKTQGAQLLCGGHRVYPKGQQDLQHGFYIEPTIFDNVSPDARIAQEEIFGPVLCVMSFNTEEEAIAMANNTTFGLAGYAATKNLARAQRLGQRLSTGTLVLRGSNKQPAGGVSIASEKQRQSGVGYSGGVEGLAAYTVTTTVHVLT
ncbi:aldehyde dehydrogenase family protein [Porticoccaceae bacterium]|nr:aldehyde dehydrogenase family protein [Porticoccaceae bacterium]